MYIYEQSSGNLLDNNGKLLTSGYSGKDKCKNDPKSQNIKNFGPIPQGNYTIGKSYDSPHTGGLTLPLTPDKNNKMFRRSAFCIHGDNIGDPGTASNGCIIINRNIRKFIDDNNDKILVVIE